MLRATVFIPMLSITTADILRNSLQFYHESIFNEDSQSINKELKLHRFNQNDRYVKHLEKECEDYEKKIIPLLFSDLFCHLVC